MVEKSAGEFRYWAFLSYSHKDATAARTLHRRLETYRIPARLAGTSTALGRVPDRLWPIFRDRDELPAATDLSETVRRALDHSGALIILCSPEAAHSLWVAEEIRTFRALHPERPILAAILSGSPPDCFPGELRRVDAHGESHEPLATDLRPGGDGAQPGLLKLVAGITGLGLDDLVQRDAARRIRRVTAVTVGALVAMLMMAALTVIALNARAEAERQRAEAEGLVEFMLTDLRERLRGVGRLDVLAAVNQRALAHYSRQGDLRRLPADALSRRARILHAIGEDYLARQRFQNARNAFRQAAETTGEQLRRDPGNPDRIFDQSQSEFWLGRIDYDQAHFQEARPAFERYRRLTERLVVKNPSNPLWLQEAGYAAGNLCSIALGDPVDSAAAVRLCGAAVRRMEQVAILRTNDPGATVDLANRYGWMVDALDANGQWDVARRYRSRHEALVQRLIRSDPRNLDYRDIWMRSQFGFGRLLLEHGEEEEARRRFADAAATARLLCHRDPHNESWRSFRRRIATALAQINEER
jgi:tetratricopeptide (TPR) repeat protein